MASRVRRHQQPAVERLLCAADREDELGCLAAADRDGRAAHAHFATARELRQQARELEA